MDTVDEIREQLENDDPWLSTITIAGDAGPYSLVPDYMNPYWPPDDNWEEDGISIGYNTGLTEFGFHGHEVYSDIPPKTLRKFLRACAENRSIEKLSFYDCFSEGPLIGSKYFDCLSQFFAHNHNLRSLHVHGCEADDVYAVAEALEIMAKHKNSLEHLHLQKSWGGLYDERYGQCYELRNGNNHLVNKFFAALSGHRSLKTLILVNNNVARYACKALAALLRDPHCVLEHLDLQENAIDDVGANYLVGALAEENCTVREFHIGYNRLMSENGWQEIAPLLAKFTAFSTHQPLGENIGSIFTDNLSRNMTLSNLELSAGLSDDNVAALMHAFIRNKVPLTELDIRGNGSITVRGITEVANFLTSSNCGLKKLKFHLEDDGALTVIADALRQNRTLTHLTCATPSSPSTWNLFEQVLCDASTVETIYRSNHTLEEIESSRRFPSSDKPPEVTSYLLKNHFHVDKMSCARRKILQHHFNDQKFDMQHFTDMDVKVLPIAMKWMAEWAGKPLWKDDLTRFYRFIKNMTSIYNFGGIAEKEGGNQRRCSKRRKIGRNHAKL